MVSAPLVLVFNPPANVVLPAPDTVTLLPAPVMLPNVNNALEPTLNVALPVRVVAPNVNPAVPLVTFVPAFTVNVFAPMLSVPNVCVTPVPDVARSEIIVLLPFTVTALPKLVAVSACKSNVVPLASDTVPVPKAEELVRAINVPVLRVVPPVYVFVPDNV